MKICVIGDSHCSALVAALMEGDMGGPDVSFTFFAAPMDHARHLGVSNGCLVPDDPDVARIIEFTSGGKTSLDPEDHDRFLVYGFLEQPRPFHSDEGHTPAVRREILRGRFEQSLGRLMVVRLRQITDKPVDFAPAPFCGPPKATSPVVWKMDYDEEVTRFRELFESIGARYWPQPPETIVPGGTRATRPEFGKNARVLAFEEGMENSVHDESDLLHANSEYGRIWLRRYLNALREDSGA